MDIKIGLTIKDDLAEERAPGQRGVAVAFDAVSGQAHVEAYGFEPSKNGAVALCEMMREIIDALEDEIGDVPGAPVAAQPRLDHNTLDHACAEHIEGEVVSGAARCPVCRPVRPVRPPFNPQPIGAQPKQ